MKLSVLAVDFDGTIAHDDELGRPARGALASARSAGIAVLLVTGRVLDELRRVAGDLHFVDGVVAENGAVVHFPESDHTTPIAPPIPPAFLDELTRQKIAFVAGHSLADAAAEDGPRLLDVIRTLELPLTLAFNRGRVMVLPQGVSKATGLQRALGMLRRSLRNTLAIGDAENDHEMLRVAEVGAAVEWGSASLRAVADVVITGPASHAVADYVNAVAPSRSLPKPERARRRLVLGRTEDGAEFSLAVRGRNVLIAGDAKSGKSWVAGLLCEQLILHGYCVCVIDPEGDYQALEGLPGVSVLGGDAQPPTPRELLRALRYPDASVVIDLSRLPQDEKIAYILAVLPALNAMRQRTGLPHRIVVDEAHYFLHDAGARHLLDLETNGYTVVTYCASRLPTELLDATEVMIVTCESSPAEVSALYARCAGCQHADPASWPATLAHLPLGYAVALPITEEAGGELRRFTIGRRLTPHVRHREKYVDVPVPGPRAFVFSAEGQPPFTRVFTLREFVHAIETAPPRSLDGYLRRGDFSRWIAEVFGDRALADELHALERRHHATSAADTLLAMANAIRGRYDLGEEAVPATPFAA